MWALALLSFCASNQTAQTIYNYARETQQCAYYTTRGVCPYKPVTGRYSRVDPSLTPWLTAQRGRDGVTTNRWGAWGLVGSHCKSS